MPLSLSIPQVGWSWNKSPSSVQCLGWLSSAIFSPTLMRCRSRTFAKILHFRLFFVDNSTYILWKFQSLESLVDDFFFANCKGLLLFFLYPFFKGRNNTTERPKKRPEIAGTTKWEYLSTLVTSFFGGISGTNSFASLEGPKKEPFYLFDSGKLSPEKTQLPTSKTHYLYK